MKEWLLDGVGDILKGTCLLIPPLLCGTTCSFFVSPSQPAQSHIISIAVWTLVFAIPWSGIRSPRGPF